MSLIENDREIRDLYLKRKVDHGWSLDVKNQTWDEDAEFKFKIFL